MTKQVSDICLIELNITEAGFVAHVVKLYRVNGAHLSITRQLFGTCIIVQFNSFCHIYGKNFSNDSCILFWYVPRKCACLLRCIYQDNVSKDILFRKWFNFQVDVSFSWMTNTNDLNQIEITVCL